MLRRTKIIATIGPATDSDEMIMPRKHDNWTAMIDASLGWEKAFKEQNTLQFPDVYYLDENTNAGVEATGFHMMDHYMRSTAYDCECGCRGKQSLFLSYRSPLSSVMCEIRKNLSDH